MYSLTWRVNRWSRSRSRPVLDYQISLSTLAVFISAVHQSSPHTTLHLTVMGWGVGDGAVGGRGYSPLNWEDHSAHLVYGINQQCDDIEVPGEFTRRCLNVVRPVNHQGIDWT